MVPVFVLSAWAQGPYNTGTYYQAADGKKGAELKSALFQVISPHEVQSYTPGVWNGINSYDIRPDGKIWDIYSGISNFTPKDNQHKGEDVDEEGKVYNREHAMPKSWFNEGSGATDYPMYTDLHHLFPTDCIVNSMRSNYPYGEVDKSKTPTKQSEGGFSKFGICDPAIGYTVVNGKARVFEPNDEYKGDLARVYFYMATCYEAYKTNAGKNRSPLDWDHSDKTMLDGTIFPRNPFVDYPGLEQYIWGVATDVAFSYDNYAVPTSILLVKKGVEEVTTPADKHFYNMKGQRVKYPRKGVYIHKARKVIVK